MMLGGSADKLGARLTMGSCMLLSAASMVRSTMVLRVFVVELFSVVFVWILEHLSSIAVPFVSQRNFSGTLPDYILTIFTRLVLVSTVTYLGKHCKRNSSLVSWR